MEKWNANSNLWVVAWAGKRRHGYGGDEVEWKQRGDEQCHEPIDTKMGGGAGEAAAFDAAAATGASIAMESALMYNENDSVKVVIVDNGRWW